MNQKYYRHKDNYRHDSNNEIHGMELRKLTMVIFLNDNIDEVQATPRTQMGELRLYPNGVGFKYWCGTRKRRFFKNM